MNDLAFAAQPMVFECLCHRPGGSTIDMGDGQSLNFKPHTDGRHIGVVTDPAHITRLMQIPEGYRLLGALQVTAPVAAPAADVTASVITAPVVEDEPVPDFGALPIATTSEDVPFGVYEVAADTSAASSLDGITIQEARVLFEQETGNKAPPATKLDTLVAKIKAARDARAA